jgi:hypothetical protein
MTQEDEPHVQAPVSRRRRRGPRAFSFSLGEALARSFGCFGRHLPVLGLFALGVFVPLVVFQLGVGERAFRQGAQMDESLRALGYGALRLDFWGRLDRLGAPWARLFDLGLPLLLQATVTFGVFQYLSGGSVNYGRSLGRGMARILPVLGVAILTGLLALAVLFVIGFLMTAVLSTIGGGLGAAILLLLVVMVVLFVIITVFFVSVQATIVERVGPAAAMARSAFLTRGARWKIFAVVVLVGIATALVQWVVRQGFGAEPETWSAARMAIVLSTAVAAIFSVFQAVAAAVVYHDLRRAKEGVGLEELMRVFD